MNKYVVRQPIKDKQGNLFGYEILFQEERGSGLYNQRRFLINIFFLSYTL